MNAKHRWRALCRLCCTAALLAALPAAGQAPLLIHTSDLPPFSMEGQPQAPGALNDMVAELLRRTGIPGTISFMPWSRAVYLTSHQSRSAVFPLTRSPEREQRYRWLARLYHEHFVFLSEPGGPVDSKHPERSKAMRVGVLRGSLIARFLKDQGYHNLVEATSVEEGLRFLNRGIVDAVVGDRSIFRHVLRDHGDQALRMSEPVWTTTTWLGGSLDLGQAEVAQFQKAMQAMQDDGSYAKILKKYGLAPGP
ncbi:MAG: substrate-binding periplasmic protein [Massilia sp.]